jgi:hypothetical protein
MVLICYSLTVSSVSHCNRNFALWRRKEDEKRNSWKKEEPTLPEGFDFNSVVEYADAAKKIQMRKDKRMARDDPMRYCADRCVATGFCEVFEDMFEMGPKEVREFCLECVLSDGEEPCDLPEKFLDDVDKPSWERTSLLRP